MSKETCEQRTRHHTLELRVCERSVRMESVSRCLYLVEVQSKRDLRDDKNATNSRFKSAGISLVCLLREIDLVTAQE